jgi:hypothetical protein
MELKTTTIVAVSLIAISACKRSDGGGATEPPTLRPVTADRYVSVYVLDNEHMTLHILKGSGTTHTFDKQEDTRYVVAIPRVQVFDASDDDDVAAAASILRTVKVESGSMEPKPVVNWDWDEMMKLRASYENDFKQFTQYPSDWQGKRGDVDRYKGHNIAVATSWGLFPETECVYIAQSPGLDATGCFSSLHVLRQQQHQRRNCQIQ